jgi:hypothetical protein
LLPVELPELLWQVEGEADLSTVLLRKEEGEALLHWELEGEAVAELWLSRLALLL